MMKLPNVLSLILLTMALYGVDAASIAQCTDVLPTIVLSKVESCLVAMSYARCLLMETTEYVTPYKEEDMGKFKSQYTAGLAKNRLICDLDIMSVVEEIMTRGKIKLEGSTLKPKGYQNSRNVGECVDSFEAETVPTVTCAQVIPYFKCIIRVLKLHILVSDSTKEEQRKMDTIIGKEMSKFNTKCDVTFSGLVQEVLVEQWREQRPDLQQAGTGNGSAIVVSAICVLTVVITCVSMVDFH